MNKFTHDLIMAFFVIGGILAWLTIAVHFIFTGLDEENIIRLAIGCFMCLILFATQYAWMESW